MNFAAVTQAPVVFVCQNNQFAISVQHDKQTATKTYAEKAVAYGMPGVRVDGNDILAVYQAVSEAAERARNGAGPTLIEALTYRLTPHSSSEDPSRYRDEATYQKWLKRDPVEIFRRHLRAKRIVSEAWEAKEQAVIDAEVDVAIKEAEAGTLPAPETMFYDVYEAVPDFLKDEAREMRKLIGNGAYEWPPKEH